MIQEGIMIHWSTPNAHELNYIETGATMVHTPRAPRPSEIANRLDKTAELIEQQFEERVNEEIEKIKDFVTIIEY